MSDKLTIEQRHRDLARQFLLDEWPSWDADSATVSAALQVMLARFEASLRTPTPEQVEEAAKRIAQAGSAIWPHDASRYRKYAAAALRASTPPAQPVEPAISHPFRGGQMLDFGGDTASELNKSATDPANSTQGLATPAQPTADAGYVTCPSCHSVWGRAPADVIHKCQCGTRLNGHHATMSGDYVMVPREAVTEATTLIEVFQQNFCQPHFDTWVKCREVLDAFAASPTGGE